MLVLPVPMIIALLLFGFLVQRMSTRETHVTILAMIGICAIQAVIISLVHYYGVAALRPLQAVLATAIPPIAWAAFVNAAGGDLRRHKMIWHGAGAMAAVLCLMFNPYLLDVLIPLSFTAYGLAMLRHMWRGEDSLLHSSLESGSKALLAWRILAVSLIASAFCDVLIAYSMATGAGTMMLWLPSVVSSISLLSLGVVGLSHAIESHREQGDEEQALSPEDMSRDLAIMAKLDDYMKTHRPWLDPDLTLSRLARKLLLPAKQLSAAINRVKGENVSRYINTQRIEEACRLMGVGKSVTTAMFESGFNTKSNFNREFLRVKGQSPRGWIDSNLSS